MRMFSEVEKSDRHARLCYRSLVSTRREMQGTSVTYCKKCEIHLKHTLGHASHASSCITGFCCSAFPVPVVSVESSAGTKDKDCPIWDHVIQLFVCCGHRSECSTCDPTPWLYSKRPGQLHSMIVIHRGSDAYREI